ncbi:hypothetical protein [Lacticaseibacillus porcinae]|uniref:hypothetical protein n=1 Tax=Lacticaseibacillus porcinae TaxID=1123687 RepID=UPI000F7A7B68|nr:hypothetical protein [Lacticaseibacillus porcinae]
MKKNNFSKRFLLIFAILFGIASVGSTVVAADSNETGSAVVSFTHQTLNPNNPRLPLSDTSGEVANDAKPSTGQKTVVVDTTPEKTKVTATSSSTKRTSLPATSGRTSLPQTGTETMPIVLVMISIAMGLMMGWQVLKNGRNLAK